MTPTADHADPLDAVIAAAFGPPSGLPAAFGAGLGVAVPLSEPGGEPRYELFEEIARGGMGVLRHARDTQLNRDVAVKVLRDDLAADPDLRRRFVGEARLAGQLQHPGIAPVYDLGRLDDHRPYFSMKLVKGRTLAEVLAETVWPDGKRTVTPVLPHGGPMFDVPTPELNRLIGILEQVCQAVGYAHSKGIVHRDLKPANVMVGEFGEVLVLDWGLAREEGARPDETRPDPAGASDPAATRPGTVMGTPAYMAPEQARGEVDRLDERCDVFALGAILCEIITGKPPYPGTTAAEVRRRAETWTAEAADRAVTCAAGWTLYKLARECLAPNPADRPAHAGVVAARLVAYRNEARGTAELNSTLEAGVVAVHGEADRWRAWSRTMWVVVVALVVTAGFFFWQWTECGNRLRVSEAELAEQHKINKVLSMNQLAMTMAEIGDTDARAALDALKAGKPAEADERFAAAAMAYRTAIDTPDSLGVSSGVRTNYGLVLLHTRKHAEAGAQFDEAVRRNPQELDKLADMLLTHAHIARAAGRANTAAACERERDRILRARK